MRYVLAVIAGSVLAVVFVALSKLLLLPFIGSSVYPLNNLAVLVILAVCLMIAHNYRATSSTDVARPASTQGNLREIVSGRFPRSVNFVPSDAVVRYYRKQYGNIPNVLDDSDWQLWQYVIKAFPRQPRTQAESDANEQKLWRFYAHHLSQDTGKGVSLLNQQAIIDYFIGHEKWVFRYYYAATGTVHETYAIQLCEVLKDRVSAGSESWVTTSNDRVKQKQFAAIDRTEEQLRRFRRDVALPFAERWGAWFFFNVQSAFTKKQQHDDGFGPSTPAGPAGGLEDEATRWQPNA